jgi:hypothetical protein
LGEEVKKVGLNQGGYNCFWWENIVWNQVWTIKKSRWNLTWWWIGYIFCHLDTSKKCH